MDNSPINILLIEDNPGDIRLVKEVLAEAPEAHFKFESAGWLSAGLELLLRKDFDIVLLDLGLPDSQGLATLDAVSEIKAEAPIVVLAALADEELAKRAIEHGAQDYLLKDDIHSKMLWRVIHYALARSQAEKILRESEAKYRELANSISDIFFAMDSELRYTYWNKASEELTGVPADYAVGKHLYDIFPATEVTKRVEIMYREVLETKDPGILRLNILLGTGTSGLKSAPTPQKTGSRSLLRTLLSASNWS